MAIRLEDFLFPKPEDAESEQFKIDTPEKADWALRKYAQAKKAVDEFTRQRDDMIAQANEWLAEVSKEHLETMRRMESLLMEYHREQLRQNPKAKTITRPAGTLKSVTRNKWHYRENDLLKWLKEHRPDLVRVKEEPNKDQLKKVAKVHANGFVYTEDGEKIEGVMVTPETKFSIEVK